jgi:hypothetical protein
MREGAKGAGALLLAVAAAAGLAAPLRAQSRAPADQTCVASATLLRPEEPLVHAQSEMHTEHHLDILAIGSGSLLGPRGGARGSLPDRMVSALEAASPGTSISLTVTGERAEPAAEMLGRLKRQLAAHHYPLIVWQTGTVEALRRQPAPAQFQATLAEGAKLAAAAGADLVLIDLPYSRLLQAKADLQPYEDAIAAVAALPGVLRFPRFSLMHAWSDAGVLDLENVPRRDRFAAAQRLRDCLGQALARFVVMATQIGTGR